MKNDSVSSYTQHPSKTLIMWMKLNIVFNAHKLDELTSHGNVNDMTVNARIQASAWIVHIFFKIRHRGGCVRSSLNQGRNISRESLEYRILIQTNTMENITLLDGVYLNLKNYHLFQDLWTLLHLEILKVRYLLIHFQIYFV